MFRPSKSSERLPIVRKKDRQQNRSHPVRPMLPSYSRLSISNSPSQVRSPHRSPVFSISNSPSQVGSPHRFDSLFPTYKVPIPESNWYSRKLAGELDSQLHHDQSSTIQLDGRLTGRRTRRRCSLWRYPGLQGVPRSRDQRPRHQDHHAVPLSYRDT
jgi:hypothetical protein